MDQHASGHRVPSRWGIDGNVYAAGDSNATWQGANPPVRDYSASNDAYVVKLTPDGALTWNTFLGGGASDVGSAVAVDVLGKVYIAGTSRAAWGLPLRPYSSPGDMFAASLDPAGALAWNTFLGGSGEDYGLETAVIGNGSMYATGISYVTWGSPVLGYTYASDAFVALINAFNLDLPLISK